MDNELKLKLKKAILDGFTNYRASGDMKNLHGIVDYIANSIIDALIGYTASRDAVTANLRDEELLGFICNKLCTLLDFENCGSCDKIVIKKRFIFNFNIYTGDTLNTCMFCSSTYNISDENSTDTLCPKCANEYSKISDIEALTNEFLTYCKVEHGKRCYASFYSSYSPSHTLERTKLLTNKMLKFIHNISLVEPVLPHDENVNVALQCLENLLRNHIDCNNNVNFSIPSGAVNKDRNTDVCSSPLLSNKDVVDFFGLNASNNEPCNNLDIDSYAVIDSDTLIKMTDNVMVDMFRKDVNSTVILFVDSSKFKLDCIIDRLNNVCYKDGRLYVVKDNSKFDIHTEKVFGYNGLIMKFDDSNDLNTINRNLNIAKYFHAKNPDTTLYFIIDDKFKDDIDISKLIK